MLPIAADIGARLAAILPTGIAGVASATGADPGAVLSTAMGREVPVPEQLPSVRSFLMIVVDGLGQANLNARIGHAPALAAMPRRRIGTVAPSTTGAALTTLTTGRLPGEHGLIGYRIRHPRLGLVTTLSEWDGIRDSDGWQRSTPLFGLAADIGARSIVIGRPAHERSGLTSAILRGAEYLPGERIADRFALATGVLRRPDPSVVYLYVDELDRAAHRYGSESAEWCRMLERLDAALDDLLRTLPGDVGVVLTADHGIVDVAGHQQVMMDADPDLLRDVAEIGGEPRFRSLYLRPGADADALADAWLAAEGSRAWIARREEAVESGWFGPVAPETAPRLGDVIVAARKRVAYYCSSDDPRSLAMVGQHGSFSDEERGVPLALGGALAGSGFAAAVSAVATVRR